ncbi:MULTISPECIES: L-iditol 2-dehydrogenase [Cobetia]|uniref:L-iditol 2-dehydrogenase n=1 Tax=Cobetia crustatorum TaxID=553385 RepID=A0A558HI91_9GAMM|nr:MULTISPECIES: L-iditol 2-dehydrogenase [Cobetia]TVU68854.1 L-iditol 2-dehydrogenase [Cobetia crustatorum]
MTAHTSDSAQQPRDIPSRKLVGKVAVVTGGAGGIGLAIATRYVQEGASVALADIDIESANRSAVALRQQEGSQARVLAVELDVTSSVSRQSMIECVQAQLGPIDILVNNAAVFDMAPVLEVSEGMLHTMLAVNVEGLFFTLQAVARTMVDRGQGGRIINMASQAGRRGEALVSAYCASKAAVISLTQSCGLDLIKHGINVNGIAPGVVDTPMWDEVDALFAHHEHRPLGEKKRLVGEAVPFGRMGRPQDHAGAAVFLACEDSDFVVAQTLNVDGGNWMS